MSWWTAFAGKSNAGRTAMTPRALTDASGQALALGGEPRRIVSLIPSITETLFALGLDDAIVGVTAYCVEPRAGVARKIKVGGQKNPKLELIRDLSPDLVIANVEENLKEHVDRLRAWGITVWVTYPRTVAEGIGMVRELGEVTGTRARAEVIVRELEALRDDVRARTARQVPVSVFYPIWRDPYMTINADTYIHDMLALCGARNVFGDRPERYPTISLDEVGAVVHVADFTARPEIPAGRTGRIHLMDGKLFCWYGPRIAEALRTLPPLFTNA
ncbi:MAG: cobalamin-binding protein [Candidatus Rokuibacteriota bacterium]|nr:MAG: cobalamin-binding protein [Candidatus Rokubacteria bacterium]